MARKAIAGLPGYCKRANQTLAGGMSAACDLHVHSAFSIYDGLGLPKLHVARAKELGWDAVCLTEHGHLMSAPALYQAAKEAGIKPILGIEMYVTPEEFLIDGDKTVTKQTRHLTVIALSVEGYHNLVAWSNFSMQRPAFYSKPRITIEKMIHIAPFPLHHNVIFSGCLGGELCQSLLCLNGDAGYAGAAYIESMKAVFPNFYIEIMDHSNEKYLGGEYENYENMILAQTVTRDKLLVLAASTNTPIVLTNDSHYPSPAQQKAHIAQLASKQHRRVQESHEGESTGTTKQGFTPQYTQWQAYMQSMEDLAERLPDGWGERAIENMHAIVDEANIILEPLDKFSYSIPRSGYDLPVDEMRRRCKARLKSMASLHGAKLIYDRFEYELSALGTFGHYLLLVADGIKMTRDNGILTWVRGSAANSLVCYCLRIHDIDPIEYKLMFERFVNPARAKMPDVDIDTESDKRDLAVRMIAEHMEPLEGKGSVMAICTYGTLANRAAFRMMADVQGFSKERIDELAALLPQMIDSGMVTDESTAYELLKDEDPELYDLASQVFDAPSTVSQHACGLVFGTRDRPLDLWVPSYRIGSSDTLVTQYNMKYIEEMGLTKQDWLRLDTLKIMRRVLQLIGKDDRYLSEMPLDDKATFDLLASGKTEGVHSFQGATQRRGCVEVKPESIHDLVVIQALYRPSGTRTGLTTSYVNRRFGLEAWEPLNDFTAEFLDETYGIAIYQEQIMEMGSAMGMSGSEVDDLYKAIKAAKGIGRGAKELFEEFEPTFRKHAAKLMPENEADELWVDWERLQGYCVVGDTEVEKGDGSKTTVKGLYDIWHGPPTHTRKKYRSSHPKKGLYLTAWRDGGIFLDKCIDIICNGEKDTWLVTLADGKHVVATANHPILTDAGWVMVGDLECGQQAVIDTGEVEPYYVPSGEGMGWTGKTVKRAVASDGRNRPALHGNNAALRSVTATLERYCHFCGAEDVRFERAHLNHDRSDNSPDNVVNACNRCHKLHDYATGSRKGRWSRGRMAGLSDVVSVEYAGKQVTYDLVMQGDAHNFVANGIVAHNTFNRGHATSYALLGYRNAFLKAHHRREFYTSILEAYPDNPQFTAATIADGFKFEPPDINNSAGGFSPGSTAKSIRIGLLRVRGVGQEAVGDIVRNQPFRSLDDLRERTSSTKVDKTVIENLRAVGALQSFGIKGDDDDLTSFQLLKFVPRKPVAFNGCKPEVRQRRGGSWKFRGLMTGFERFNDKSFCAKMFWLPPLEGDKLLTKKASAMGSYYAWLLAAVDENGLPFDLIVSDKKDSESKLVRLLAKQNTEPGSVICVEGQPTQPFLKGRPTGFRMWGVSGADDGYPQCWHMQEETAKLVCYLADEKRRERRT